MVVNDTVPAPVPLVTASFSLGLVAHPAGLALAGLRPIRQSGSHGLSSSASSGMPHASQIPISPPLGAGTSRVAGASRQTSQR